MKKQSVGRLRRPPQGLSKEAGNCTRKRQGELSEIAFALKAVQLGFGISQPVGDSRRYDFILDSGQHLWRIQVKSTGGVHDRGYVINAYWASKGHVPYTAEQIDFLVAHVISHDAWYIIPVEAFVPRTCLPLYPAADSKHVGRYEKYREAWSLLKSNHKPDQTTPPRSSHGDGRRPRLSSRAKLGSGPNVRNARGLEV